MLTDGAVILTENMFNIVLLVGMSQVGHMGQVKQCTMNAYYPNITIQVGQLTEHILRHTKHMDNHVGDPLATFPAPQAATAFFASAPPHKRTQPPSSDRTSLDKRVNYLFAEKCGF
jgi:hypothetical protein